MDFRAFLCFKRSQCPSSASTSLRRLQLSTGCPAWAKKLMAMVQATTVKADTTTTSRAATMTMTAMAA
jgi:hypothetical protein